MKKRKLVNFESVEKTVDLRAVVCDQTEADFPEQKLKERAAYFLLNGAPTLALNDKDGKYALLSSPLEFVALQKTGATQGKARVYKFTDKDAEIFSLVEKLKTEELGAMDQAYAMQRLVKEYRFTQEDVALMLSKSRPAVANTLRLLTLEPEVVGLVESGQLSAGHARTLVKVDKDKQLAFAQESIKRGYTVREMERAVKTFLTPPEVLQKEKEAIAAAKNAELKALVERMRSTFRTKVSLIGNSKKGRIYIDYYSPEDLYRFEEMLDMIDGFNDR
ncbi:MAG: ParB/RepB/Spo0J family partition protein [Clostridia bacterium]|nr:ParB/RepB/Spo0J family partition protein [Clostridia bacterium]